MPKQEKLTIVPQDELNSRVLLTLPETAGTYFGISGVTMYKRLERRQAPPVVRIGKRVFFRRTDVESWIADHVQSA
jgi:predicted DNA-binding transcriptional regulator AlpA